jgi:hypothetical protein
MNNLITFLLFLIIISLLFIYFKQNETFSGDLSECLPVDESSNVIDTGSYRIKTYNGSEVQYLVKNDSTTFSFTNDPDQATNWTITKVNQPTSNSTESPYDPMFADNNFMFTEYTIQSVDQSAQNLTDLIKFSIPTTDSTTDDNVDSYNNVHSDNCTLIDIDSSADSALVDHSIIIRQYKELLHPQKQIVSIYFEYYPDIPFYEIGSDDSTDSNNFTNENQHEIIPSLMFVYSNIPKLLYDHCLFADMLPGSPGMLNENYDETCDNFRNMSSNFELDGGQEIGLLWEFERTDQIDQISPQPTSSSVEISNCDAMLETECLVPCTWTNDECSIPPASSTDIQGNTNTNDVFWNRCVSNLCTELAQVAQQPQPDTYQELTDLLKSIIFHQGITNSNPNLGIGHCPTIVGNDPTLWSDTNPVFDREESVRRCTTYT